MNSLQENYTAFATLLRREITRILRIWVQTLIPPVITMALYFVIFGHLIGQQIGDMDGFSYMQFIVPGLVMMSVVTNSYGNVVTSFFSTKFQGNIEEMIVAPLPLPLLLLGYVCGGICRAAMIGGLVMLVAMFFTDVTVKHGLLMITVVLLSATLFSLAGFTNALFARKFDDIAIVPTFILTPLTYLGGVFYSINLLSPFWHKVSMINPVLYMVNAFRYSMLGVSDVNVLFALGMILFFIVILFFINLTMLRRGIGLQL